MRQSFVSEKFLLGLILCIAAAAFAVIGLIPVALILGVFGFTFCFPDMVQDLIDRIMNLKK